MLGNVNGLEGLEGLEGLGGLGNWRGWGSVDDGWGLGSPGAFLGILIDFTKGKLTTRSFGECQPVCKALICIVKTMCFITFGS